MQLEKEIKCPICSTAENPFYFYPKNEIKECPNHCGYKFNGEIKELKGE